MQSSVCYATPVVCGDRLTYIIERTRQHAELFRGDDCNAAVTGAFCHTHTHTHWPKSAYCPGRGATQGRTPGLHRGAHQWGATRPEDASVAIPAQPGDLIKMVQPLLSHTHARTHTYTHSLTHSLRTTVGGVSATCGTIELSDSFLSLSMKTNVLFL